MDLPASTMKRNLSDSAIINMNSSFYSIKIKPQGNDIFSISEKKFEISNVKYDYERGNTSETKLDSLSSSCNDQYFDAEETMDSRKIKTPENSPAGSLKFSVSSNSLIQETKISKKISSVSLNSSHQEIKPLEKVSSKSSISTVTSSSHSSPPSSLASPHQTARKHLEEYQRHLQKTRSKHPVKTAHKLEKVAELLEFFSLENNTSSRAEFEEVMEKARRVLSEHRPYFLIAHCCFPFFKRMTRGKNVINVISRLFITLV